MQIVVNTLVISGIYILFALGMSLVWGSIGIVNFAHGQVFMFSTFLSYLVSKEVDLPMVAFVAIGVGFGAILSVAAHLLVFQPIVSRSKSLEAAESQILIGGIGIAAILLAIAQRETQSVPFGFYDTGFQTEVYRFWGVQITNVQIITITATVVLSALLVRWMRVSKAGLALRSLSLDPETAALMGVNSRRLSIAVMALAGALAGLAGVLLTYQLTAITPETGDLLLFKAFAIVVLGGLGSLTGTLMAAVTLGACETVVLTETSGAWVDAISFGLIVLVLLVRPRGFLGKREVRRV
jgi:branched-chain amino acid transport system permease protein